MTESEWKTFLAEYNRELMSYEEVVEALPRAVIKAGWLGSAGASEKALVKTEQRLASRLPPSYRSFLKVSNGWRFPSTAILDLLPAAKVTRFREKNKDWIDAYTNSSTGLPPVPDKKYFVYGPKQDCVNFRAEHLRNAVQISSVAESAVVLLNPEVLTPEGEWETWFFANWLPGAVRYRSFAEWLGSERSACRKHLKPLTKVRVEQYVTAKKPVSLKKAQSAARSGQTTLALESLETFAAKGDGSATASLAELYAFLGEWDKAIANAGRLIADPTGVYAGNVFNDMVQLLGRAGHRSGNWSSVIEAVETASKANATQLAAAASNRKDKISRETIKNFEQRNEKIFQNLIDYARRRGKPPHELLAIFGVPNVMDNMSEEERRILYNNAAENVDAIRPDLKKNTHAKMEHLFALAKFGLEDEAVSLFEKYAKSFVMAWQSAEYVAGVYMRRRNPIAAWAAIEANLKHWWPVDYAQVAPIVLLINEHLETLMTPERCQLVLSTPRGPEAARAKSK